MSWKNDGEYEMVRILMKLVAFYFQVLFQHSPRETEEKNYIFSGTIADISTGIRTSNFLNTNLDLYHYLTLSSVDTISIYCIPHFC
jgi:hypothetical protein